MIEVITIVLSTKLLCAQNKCVSVAIGAPNTPTPTGCYRIRERVLNPKWVNPYNSNISIAGGAVNNPLGRHALVLDVVDCATQQFRTSTTIAIHGNSDPSSIGKAASHGCIRMHNKDITSLFDHVLPNYTVIKIIK